MIILNEKENKAYNMDNMICIGTKDNELNCRMVNSAEKVVIATFEDENLAIDTLKDVLSGYSREKDNLYIIRNYDVDRSV